MIRLTVAAALTLIASIASADLVELLHEDFEDATVAYVTSIPESSDGDSDFFTRTDGSNITSTYEIAGVQGAYYFAAMDTDATGDPGDPGADIVTLTFAGIDITGYADLTFSGLFAEDDLGTGVLQHWDGDSSVHVSASIDGATPTTVLAFESLNPSDSEPRLDADFSGTGEGTPLTDTLNEFTADILGEGDLLTLAITISYLDGNQEDVALDDIRLFGALVAVPEPAGWLLGGVITAVFAIRRRGRPTSPAPLL